MLTAFAEGNKSRLLPKDKFFLSLFVQMLKQNLPREIQATNYKSVLIFTDACYERDDDDWPCGIGGVLCCDLGFQFFSVPVNLRGRVASGEKRKKQIIFEAETLAAVTAFALWRPVVAGKRCVLFVDNEGTKFSLLKGTSENETVDLFAGFFTELEAGVHTYSWLARVPSKCNIADPPSRNDLSMPFFDNAMDVSKEACAISEELISKILQIGEKGFETSQTTKRKLAANVERV